MKKKKLLKEIKKNAVLEHRIEILEEETGGLRAAVNNLQNFTRILERDICNCRGIAAIGESVKDSVLKAKE